MNPYYLCILTIFAYASVALATGLHLFGCLPTSRCRFLTGSLLSLTGHGWLLYQLIETPMGQNLDKFIMFSLTLWLMNILTVLTSLRAKIENLCVLTYPLAGLSLAFALYFGGSDIVDTKTQPGVLAHIFISLFAMSLLTLASLQALLMGFQHYLLKRHHPSAILQILPPLQTMETLLFNIILSGLLFLSGALISGIFFLHSLLLFPKMLLALSAWILLALLLIGRARFGWRGTKAIHFTLMGVGLVFLSYFGATLLT